ncbi:MAG: serine/threonine-protein kinase [Pseudonocardia sp.]
MNSPGATGPTVLARRYRLDERIGAGSMGAVWRATDELLDRTVAVKQLLLQPGAPGFDPQAHEEARQRILREGRLAARLQNAHTIGVFDVVLHDDVPWLVMEYLESRTLGAVLVAEGPMEPHRAAAVGRQVAAGLAAAHAAGIVHRDVKPGNILIGDDGTVKITDFGVSRAADDVQLTRTGLIAGTPAFLAPEVARGQTPSTASDVFALGSTIYAAVEGEPPFGLDDNAFALLYAVGIGDFRRPVHAGPLTDILVALLDKDPARRPSATQARDWMAVVAAGGGPPAAARRHAASAAAQATAPRTTATPSAGAASESAVADGAASGGAASGGAVADGGSGSPALGGWAPAYGAGGTRLDLTPSDPRLPGAAERAERPEEVRDPGAVPRDQRDGGPPTVAAGPAEPGPGRAAVHGEPPQASGWHTPQDPAGAHGPGTHQSSEREAGGAVRRRTARRLVLAAAVVVLLLGAAVAVAGPTWLGPRPGPSAAPPATAGATPPTTAPEAQEPDGGANEPDTGAPSNGEGQPDGGQADGEQPSAADLEQFVRDYYALLPGDTDQAWELLGEQARAESNGLEGYRNFYSTIGRIEFAEGPTAVDGSTVRARLVFESTNGAASGPEAYEFEVVPDPDGGLEMSSFSRG